MLTRMVSVAAVLGVAGAALAQYDNSSWPTYRGGAERRGAVEAPGPAVNHAFTLSDFSVVSPGGFSVAENGDIYFKNGSTVYRLDPSDGSVLAQSPAIGGAWLGDYAGVSITPDAVWTCTFLGAGNSSIVKLNKQTLAVEAEFTNPAFQGLRGTPLVGAVPNNRGNVNIYVHDRNGVAIHAVDSVTGDLEWTYNPIYDTPFGQMGPQWTTAGGRDAFAYFGNGSLVPGAALRDNGDGSFTVLWEEGPESFNWFGSGSLSEDGQRIYVTTFNDNGAPSLWAIRVSDGGVAWSIPHSPDLNFFARPSVIGNRVYAFGHNGTVAAFEDNVTSGELIWRHATGVGEFTAGSAVETPGGDVYLYASNQESATGVGQLLVLKDEGPTFDVVLDTTLNGQLRWSLFSSGSATIDNDGNLWLAGGRHDDPTPGDIYKFSVDDVCYPDCDGSGTLDFFDFLCFQNAFLAGDPYADCDGSGMLDFFDFLCFQNEFLAGC